MAETETEEKRVVVTGATGLIGKALCKQLRKRGYPVVVFSRNPDRARKKVPGAAEYVAWEPGSPGPWASAIDGSYAVINFAGAPIFGKRWNERVKRNILNSRVQGTRGLVEAMAQAKNKPKVFISGSAVGYYGPREGEKLDESAPPGNDFLSRVVQAWEAEAAKAEVLGVRTVMARTGIVLDRREGALALMSLPFRLFVGGPVLPGTQWFSWVHIEDEVGIILMALENESVRGPINATAPEAQTNRVFSSTLGKVLHRPSLIPVPGFALTIVFSDAANVLTTGQRVIPMKAQEAGYQFKYSTGEQALRQIYGK